MNPINNFSDLMSDMSDGDPGSLQFIVTNAVPATTTENIQASRDPAQDRTPTPSAKTSKSKKRSANPSSRKNSKRPAVDMDQVPHGGDGGDEADEENGDDDGDAGRSAYPRVMWYENNSQLLCKFLGIISETSRFRRALFAQKGDASVGLKKEDVLQELVPLLLGGMPLYEAHIQDRRGLLHYASVFRGKIRRLEDLKNKIDGKRVQTGSGVEDPNCANREGEYFIALGVKSCTNSNGN
ncbi:hypothetical protein V1525DRAFT_398298 [Lipomyces kononenkoae]|uniref:Uncharacterized protein n=1 Tax=Lipomyces kononenkoae TaxID=34357 RepID=A0ACC3T6G4_LIPKO